VQLLRSHAERSLEKIDPDGTLRRAAEHVVDLDAETSTCPACMDEVPRGARRCPGCGLRFG